jgi:hypothetical protein
MLHPNRDISTQGTGIYRLCSRQATKKQAVCAKKTILFYFWNTQAYSWLITAQVEPFPSTLIW